MTTRLDWVRAGALAAGVCTLLAFWWLGLVMLGYARWSRSIDWPWVASILVGVAAGMTLGHRAPGPPLPRMVLALLVGGLFAAVEIGLLFLLATAGLRDRGQTLVFLLLGLVLVAWGLRRLPTSKAARTTFLIMVVLLTLIRLLTSVPLVARHLERRFFPLPTAVVRRHWNVYQCWAACSASFGRVVDWRIDDLSYEINDYDHLTADVRVTATVEALAPYFVDGCHQVYSRPVEAPEEVRGYATTVACKAANKFRQTTLSYPNCCVAEIHHRNPGDRFQSTRTTRFVFRDLRWSPQVEEPDANTPRPYVILD